MAGRALISSRDPLLFLVTQGKLYPSWCKPITVIPSLLGDWFQPGHVITFWPMTCEEKSKDWGESRGASQNFLDVRDFGSHFAIRRGIRLRTRRHKENARIKKWKVI